MYEHLAASTRLSNALFLPLDIGHSNVMSLSRRKKNLRKYFSCFTQPWLVAISAMRWTYTWRSARGVCKDTRGADRAHHKSTVITHVASILSVLHVPCAVTLSVRIPVQVSVHWELFFICAVCHFGCGCQSPFSSTAKCLASGLQCRLSFRYSHYDSCRMQKKQHQTSIHRALWSGRALSVFW